MEFTHNIESRLLEDVEALRGQHSNTQELYREVCAIMFFRYGLTPTANRLYQLVRKGSMSAPAEALAKFWSELRERSRVTIEGPDLPEALRVGAGELVAALWKQALDAATESLSALREEAQAQMATATAAEGRALARAGALEEALQAMRGSLDASRQEIADVRHQLDTSTALVGTLRARIDDGRRELNEQHAWFKTVERDHAAALDKLRSQWQTERDAADSTRRQAGQAIDHERKVAAGLQQALDAERQSAAAATERHRAELRDSAQQVAQLHQRIGMLEGQAAGHAAALEVALRQSRRT